MKRPLLAGLAAGIFAVALVPVAFAGAVAPPRDTGCLDPSGVCPPSGGAGPHYVWSQCQCTGGSSEEFTGSTLPEDFVAADSNTSCAPPPYAAHQYSACDGVPSYASTSTPPNSDSAWFSPSQVRVSGGALQLSTSWSADNRFCNAYWGEAVFATGQPAPGCWISGSVGQRNASWAWPVGATEMFAFEAKWVGTANLANLDSTLQVASYPRWPPEVDVVETDYTGTGTGPASSFNSFVHCPASGKAQNVDGSNFPGDGSPNGAPISTNMTSWHTYELDVSPSAITIYVDRQLRWTLDENDSWCTATILGSAGDGGSSSDWLPGAGAGATLGAFMEAVMHGTGDPNTSDQQTMLIDWVANAACAPGSYSVTGLAPCTSAPPGTFVATFGATSAIPCTLGTYNAVSGQTGCTKAPAGSYVPGTGATHATLCATGSFSPSSGATRCQPAPLNTYVTMLGAVAATACPTYAFTLQTGSTSKSECLYLAITTTALPGGTLSSMGKAKYSAKLSAKGGKQPYTWSLAHGKFPPGLTLGASTGIISGTAKKTGTYTFTIRVADTKTTTQGKRTAVATLSITVSK